VQVFRRGFTLPGDLVAPTGAESASDVISESGSGQAALMCSPSPPNTPEFTTFNIAEGARMVASLGRTLSSR
jgi:hypothetical protein